MAKEGSVAPKERINVTFKPATGGAQEEIELPLKLMVLGDFTQRADDRKIEDRKPISIDKNNFDEVLGKQELSLTFAVPNRLQDEETDDELPVLMLASAFPARESTGIQLLMLGAADVMAVIYYRRHAN